MTRTVNRQGRVHDYVTNISSISRWEVLHLDARQLFEPEFWSSSSFVKRTLLIPYTIPFFFYSVHRLKLLYLKTEAEAASETSCILKSFRRWTKIKKKVVSVGHNPPSKPYSVSLDIILLRYILNSLQSVRPKNCKHWRSQTNPKWDQDPTVAYHWSKLPPVS